ncbi:hypothetical protein HDU67_005327, partial [Dinochytrium kinnereticum]
MTSEMRFDQSQRIPVASLRRAMDLAGECTQVLFRLILRRWCGAAGGGEEDGVVAAVVAAATVKPAALVSTLYQGDAGPMAGMSRCASGVVGSMGVVGEPLRNRSAIDLFAPESLQQDGEVYSAAAPVQINGMNSSASLLAAGGG